jgi:hypothetical protein
MELTLNGKSQALSFFADPKREVEAFIHIYEPTHFLHMRMNCGSEQERDRIWELIKEANK